MPSHEGNFPLCKRKVNPSMKEGTAQIWTMNGQRVVLVACLMTEQCEGGGNKPKDTIANENL